MTNDNLDLLESLDDYGTPIEDVEEEENDGYYYSSDYVKPDIDPEIGEDEYERNLEDLNDPLIGSQDSGFNINKFIASEIGSEDGYVVTGSPDNPIKLKIDDLSEVQKIALLKHHYQSTSVNNELSEDELHIISKLRSGELEDLYNDLATELGKNTEQTIEDDDYDVNSYEPDSIVFWNLKQQYPNMTQEELEEQIEIAKNLPNYNKILEASTKKLQEYFNQQKQQLQNQKLEQNKVSEQQRANQLISLASQVEDLYGFELDDNDKNEALSLLIEKDNNAGLPKLLEYLQTPQGQLEAALAMTALPKISEQYEKMLSEFEKYEKKNKKLTYVEQPKKESTKKTNSFNSFFGMEEI